jgi:hypothetical protein
MLIFFFLVERLSRSACHSFIRDNVALDAALLVELNSCMGGTVARHASALLQVLPDTKSHPLPGPEGSHHTHWAAEPTQTRSVSSAINFGITERRGYILVPSD